MKLNVQTRDLADWRLDSDIKAGLVDEAYDLLREYGHMAEKKGISVAIDEWAKNKKPLIQLLQNHPNWDPKKFQIRFDADYSLQKDQNLIRWFFDMWEEVYSYQRNLLVETEYEGHKYGELMRRYNSFVNIIDAVERAMNRSVGTTEFENPLLVGMAGVYVNGKNCLDINVEKNKIRTFLQRTDQFTNESREKFDKYSAFVRTFRGYKSDVVTEDLAKFANDLFPKLRAAEGMKVSRLVNKFFTKIFDVDKIEDEKRAIRERNGRMEEVVTKYRPYNAEFAKYADAINPIKVKRHTIISVNPIDYLTMAFGNSWATCMTIDRKNKRKRGDEVFRGLSCGGVLSYMLDGVTAVVYTVDSKYNGNEFELQDKINRNLIHYRDGIMVQGRLYPQSNDSGANDLYEQFRNIEEKVIADCLGAPNLWKYEGGTETNARFCKNEYGAVHFSDFFRFDQTGTCRIKTGNASYAGDPGDPNHITKKIIIGHRGIDLRTGNEFTNEGSLLDESNIVDEEGYVICANCGQRIRYDEAKEYNGRYYCDDCVVYCTYHDRFEPRSEDFEYVDGYGRVCEEGRQELVDEGKLHWCSDHNDWVYGINKGHAYGFGWICNTCAEEKGLEYDEQSDHWVKKGVA